ncbi:hypothetical protein QQ008_06935 [Fulvivirgaceae bacterium BMA10]|uniref:Uncharacterized protein n=1 Tax=Splendidivirga corallicola TaxID=3051826 RepID=A0ABT8KK48_9BACT|nr:hypothetical protein [Fulvivirgaceae bacterium BMA10]
MKENTTKRCIEDLGNIVDIVLGDRFIVAQRSNGVIDVYDEDFKLLSSGVFSHIEKVNANSRVLIIRKNGSVDFYDKWLNYQFTKNVG